METIWKTGCVLERLIFLCLAKAHLTNVSPTAATTRVGRPRRVWSLSVHPSSTLIPLFSLLTLFLLGFALRAYRITSVPLGFFCDEASFGLNADLILHTARDEHHAFLPFLFRAFGEYKLPAFVYAEVPVMAILGRTEFAVRITAAAIGSLTVVTTYLLAKEMFRRELPAVVAAALLVILPWHFHFSRTGLGDYITAPLFVTVGLFLFLRAVRLRRHFWPAALVFGLSFYTYRTTWIFLPPLLVALCVMYQREVLRDRRDAIVSLGLLVITLAPIARHLLMGGGDRSSQVWIFNVHSTRSTLALFLDQYGSYFTSSFLFERADNGSVLRQYLPGHGVLYWFLLPLIIAGLVKIDLERTRTYWLLLAMLLIYPLPGALSDDSPTASRAIMGSVTFALIGGLGVASLAGWASHLLPRFRLAAATVVVLAVAAVGGVSAWQYFDRYFNDYPRLSAGYWGWQDGPQEILGRFVKLQDQYDDLIMDGAFNAPRIFIPFYVGNSCPKCDIGSFDRYNPARRQLFALRTENPDLNKYNWVLKDVLHYPNGSPSFVLVEVLGKR